MNEIHDLNSANNMDNNESTVQYESHELKSPEKSTNDVEKEKDETLDIDNSFNDGSESILDKTLKRTDEEADQNNEPEKKDVHSKLLRIIDSDEEDENIFISNTKNKKSAYITSDNDTSDSEHENKSRRYLNNKNMAENIFDNNSNDDTEEAISTEETATNHMRSNLQTLIDSDSEEDEEEHYRNQLSPIKHGKTAKKENSRPKLRKVSLRASKEEAMKQIHSETQRLMRKTEISLPYHKPKQRSLQEFLSRKKVITVLPKAPTMAARLKMSSAIVDEVLKEKEKEAEIFYKSSDSEEEKEEAVETDKDLENIEDIPGFKKDLISRKLFTDNSSITVEDNKENDNSNAMKETSEISIENNETTVNDGTENNVNVSMTTEIHCESSNTENRNEVSESEITEIIKNDKITDNESREENIGDNTDEHNFETVNKSSNASTSKTNDDYAKIVKKSLGLSADESDEYNEYGLPPPKIDNSPSINESKTLSSVRTLKPTLRGTPGTMIDLSDDINPNKKEVSALIDRFVHKHSKINKEIANIPKVTTTQIKTTSNGLSIIKETLPYRSPNVVNEDPKLNKPGAKLMRLKEELKHKMALKREEEWKQKEQEMKEQEIEWNVSITEENNLNEPYSPSIESHNSEDDELEENDVYTRKEKKRKKKSAFIEDEAEVSEHEINDSDEIEDEDENEIQENSEESEEDEGDEEECEKIDLEDENESSTCDSNDVPAKSKSFKRILEPLDDDSKFSYIENVENEQSEIPACQAHVENDTQSQKSRTPRAKTNTFDFISPITQLTALNVHLEEEKESNTEGSSVESILTGSIHTPELSQQIRNLNKQALSQKKLFVGEGDVLDEELMEIASGKFTDDNAKPMFSKESQISESQLLDLCSGTFTSQVDNTTGLSKEISQNTQVPEEKISRSTKVDEEQLNGKPDWNKLSVVSSDEEDLLEKEISKRPTKRVKKLDLTDDEEENSSAMSSDDEAEEDNNERYIDYDSEENEVIVPKKNIKQYAAQFLEDEAELSESDCDVSADEDEQDLDKLDFEEVDDEDIDETQVKNQVGRLHMRQLLDEDKKEVRMLQELLFEDGDLYSESARERKFKWKNIDKQIDNNDPQPLEGKDGWVDLSDEEDEVQWRKMKYEREKFLAEKMTKADTEIENDLNSSQIFNLGLKVLKKRRIDETEKQDTLVEALDSKDGSKVSYTIAAMLNNSTLKGKSRIHDVMQKRSFLARGEESLERLAALARRKEAPQASVKAKSFLFTHVDRTAENESAPVVEMGIKYAQAKSKR
ncbi:Claspin [Anthophora retusa]